MLEQQRRLPENEEIGTAPHTDLTCSSLRKKEAIVMLLWPRQNPFPSASFLLRNTTITCSAHTNNVRSAHSAREHTWPLHEGTPSRRGGKAL
eukprot:3250353-Rhodomonas_salina.1